MQSSDVFYTHFSKSYARYALTKQAFIDAVNNFIKKETSTEKTMIDVGAGDGKRSKLISDSIGVEYLTLLDNSDGMVDLAKKISNSSVIKADISSKDFKLEKKYDVVLCLWNVLGHIVAENREIALKNIASIVEDNGVIFLDINNRYNISHYGIGSVVRNILKDIFIPRKSNGDFNLKIDTDGKQISTIVHIFNPFEIEHLFKLAGLSVLKRKIINYKTGEIKNNFWEGQLVYKLKKI